MVMIVFGGCSRKEGMSGEGSGAAGSAKISMTLVRIGYNDTQIQMAKSRASGYIPDDSFYEGNRQKIEAAYPDIALDWVDWGWAEALDTKQRAMIAAGTPPTNVAGEAFYPAYAEAGLLQEVPGWVLEGVNPTYVFKGRDGKPYGVGYKTSIFMLFYNKNILREVGLDPDKPPKTWSEWKRMSEQITAAGKGKFWGGGIPSFPHNGGALRATPFFRQLGTDFGGGEVINLNDPKVQQELQFIRDMNANFPPGLANGVDEEPFWNAFRMPDQQNIAFVVDGAWNQQRSAVSGLREVGVAPLPLPDSGGQVGNCQVGACWIGVPVGVPKEVTDLFWKIFREIVLSEEQLKNWIDTNYSPALQTMLEDQSKMEDPMSYSGRVAATEIMTNDIPGQAAFYKNHAQIWEIINQNVLARSTMTNVPISQICNEAQSRIEALLR
jgi:multiple sugar transport system substrate-binding protein